MKDFYIEKLMVVGEDVAPSIIDFKKGLNIICGPSNTGKSYVYACINYALGAKDITIEKNPGYNKVILTLAAEDGTKIVVDRHMFKNKNKVNFSSTDESLPHGEMKVEEVNDIFLSLIGINSNSHIYTNLKKKKARFTWRTFIHPFFLEEEHIFEKRSVIVNPEYENFASSLFSLLFLLDGIDRTVGSELDDVNKEIEKKKAVIDYLSKRLIDLKKQEEIIKTKINENEIPTNLDERIEVAVRELGDVNESISVSTNKLRAYIAELNDLGNSIEEHKFLEQRYENLKSQYEADIKRLDFIIDGCTHEPEAIFTDHCPFCGSEVYIDDYAKEANGDSSIHERQKVKKQLGDLEVVLADLRTELQKLSKRYDEIMQEKKDLADSIGEHLKPQSVKLKNLIDAYRRKVADEKEIGALSNAMKIFADDSADNRNELEKIKKIELDPKTLFSDELIKDIELYLDEALKACNYPGYQSSRILLENFDVSVNGKDKVNEGMGYRAFLNTVFSLTLFKYLREKGNYSFGIACYDSPILTLKERDDEEYATDNMKKSLFRYFLKNQNVGQLIIIENSIPDIDYGDTNIIRFTMDSSKGRYGFFENYFPNTKKGE